MSLLAAASDAGVAFVGTLIKGNSYINSLKKGIKDAIDKNEKLKLDREIDKKQLFHLQTQVYRDLAKSKSFEYELNNAKKALSFVSGKIKEQELIITKYENKIAQLKTECANYKNVKEKEILILRQKAAQEIDQYTAELDNAKKQLYEYQKLQLQQKLTFENEIQNLQNQLPTQFTSNDLMETIQNYESKIQNLKVSQQDQVEQNDNLEEKLKYLLQQTKSREKDYNDCYEVIQEYERKLSNLLQENRQSQSELTESQSQLMAYEEIIKDLKIKVRRQNEDTQKIDLMETIQNYESKIKSLKREYQDQVELNDNFKAELAERKSQMKAYEEIIKKLKQQVTKQKNECKDQVLAYSQLASQLEKEIIKNQQLEQQLQECQEKNKRDQAEINEKLENSEREYQKELNQINQELELKKQTLKEQKLEQDRIQKQLNDVEIQERERSKNFAASYQNLMSKLLQYEKQLQNLEEQKNELQNIEIPRITNILESVEAEGEVNQKLNKEIIEFVKSKLQKLKSDHQNYQEKSELYLEKQNTKNDQVSTSLQLLNVQSRIIEQFTLLQQNQSEVIKWVKLTENSIDCLQSFLYQNFLPHQFSYLEIQQTEIKRFSVHLFQHNQIFKNNQKFNELLLSLRAYINNSQSLLNQYACKIDAYLNGIRHFQENNIFVFFEKFSSFQTKDQDMRQAYQQLKIAIHANTKFEKQLNQKISQGFKESQLTNVVIFRRSTFNDKSHFSDLASFIKEQNKNTHLNLQQCEVEFLEIEKRRANLKKEEMNKIRFSQIEIERLTLQNDIKEQLINRCKDQISQQAIQINFQNTQRNQYPNQLQEFDHRICENYRDEDLLTQIKQLAIQGNAYRSQIKQLNNKIEQYKMNQLTLISHVNQLISEQNAKEMQNQQIKNHISNFGGLFDQQNKILKSKNDLQADLSQVESRIIQEGCKSNHLLNQYTYELQKWPLFVLKTEKFLNYLNQVNESKFDNDFIFLVQNHFANQSEFINLMQKKVLNKCKFIDSFERILEYSKIKEQILTNFNEMIDQSQCQNQSLSTSYFKHTNESQENRQNLGYFINEFSNHLIEQKQEIQDNIIWLHHLMAQVQRQIDRKCVEKENQQIKDKILKDLQMQQQTYSKYEVNLQEFITQIEKLNDDQLIKSHEFQLKLQTLKIKAEEEKYNQATEIHQKNKLIDDLTNKTQEQKEKIISLTALLMGLENISEPNLQIRISEKNQVK